MNKFNNKKINIPSLTNYVLISFTIFIALALAILEQNLQFKIIIIAIMFIFLIVTFLMIRIKNNSIKTEYNSLNESNNRRNIEQIFENASDNVKVELLSEILSEVNGYSKKLETYYNLLSTYLSNISNESTYHEDNNNMIKLVIETLSNLPKYDINNKVVCPYINNIVIKNISLRNINFNNFVFFESTFVNMDFSNSTFINSNFIGTNFTGGSIESCNFRNAKFGYKLGNAATPSKINKFTRTNLGSTNFGASKIKYCEFISVKNIAMDKLLLLQRKFGKEKLVIYPKPSLVPNIDDLRWRDLILGNINHEFKCIPASFLLSRLRDRIKYDNSETSITKCIKEVHVFFCKYQSLISDDIQKIFN
ncbi:MAG: pentapeptide repeat-containing protein [Clostridiales bacterium]